MAIPRLLDLRKLRVAQMRQIDAGDFRADCWCDSLDCHGHDRLSSCVVVIKLRSRLCKVNPMKKLLAMAALGAALLASSGSAQAEANQVRFARQLGLGYLQFYVMQE